MKPAAFAAVALLATLAPAAAQEQDSARFEVRRTGVLLPGSHWAARAVRRLEAVGLADGHVAAQQSMYGGVVGDVLCGAAERAPATVPSMAELARDWCARFKEEFHGRGSPDGDRALAGAIRAGYEHRHGAAAPGASEGFRATGAAPLPDRDRPDLSAELSAAPVRIVELGAEPRYSDGRVALERWNASLVLGPVAASVRRRAVGYGSGLTLAEGGAFTQVALESVRPIGFPGPLRPFGPAAFHLFATRLHEPRHAGDPYLAGLSVVLRPHSRVTIAGRRAALVRGDSIGGRVDLRRVIEVAGGGTRRSTNPFDNQFTSGELRLRLPTERWLPLTVHAELGTDDLSLERTFGEARAYLVGATIPAVPRLPELQLGAEWTSIGPAGVPTYRHTRLLGGWAAADRPLGHALGGHGSEARLHAGLDLLDARLRMEAHAFGRRRGAQNLYSPGRQGTSTGWSGTILLRPHRKLDLELDAASEHGDGWTERRLRSSISLLF